MDRHTPPSGPPEDTRGEARPSHREMLDRIWDEIRNNYAHLNVAFLPDVYMQAKIRLAAPRASLLNQPSNTLVDILQSEGFQPDDQGAEGGSRQYVLNQRYREKDGCRFVLKAAFGPSFISFWFRNESPETRLDLPLIYALEILNRIYHRVGDAEQRDQLHRPDTLDGTATAG